MQPDRPTSENASERAKDTARFKQGKDERLSKDAGYGRTTNATKQPSKSANE